MRQSFPALGELAFSKRATMTVIHVKAEAHFEFSRGFCDLLFPIAGSGFCFGPKPHVAHYICPGLSLRSGECEEFLMLGFDTATLSSHWLCQIVVFSALGKQIHKEQITAFF